MAKPCKRASFKQPAALMGLTGSRWTLGGAIPARSPLPVLLTAARVSNSLGKCKLRIIKYSSVEWRTLKTALFLSLFLFQKPEAEQKKAKRLFR